MKTQEPLINTDELPLNSPVRQEIDGLRADVRRLKLLLEHAMAMLPAENLNSAKWENGELLLSNGSSTWKTVHVSDAPEPPFYG